MACDSHINGDYIRTGLPGHDADTGTTLCHVPRHNGSNLLPGLGHPFLHNPIVSAHYHNGLFADINRGCAGCPCNPHNVLLQDTQAVQRLCHLVPASEGLFYGCPISLFN